MLYRLFNYTLITCCVKYALITCCVLFNYFVLITSWRPFHCCQFIWSRCMELSTKFSFQVSTFVVRWHRNWLQHYHKSSVNLVVSNHGKSCMTKNLTFPKYFQFCKWAAEFIIQHLHFTFSYTFSCKIVGLVKNLIFLERKITSL